MSFKFYIVCRRVVRFEYRPDSIFLNVWGGSKKKFCLVCIQIWLIGGVTPTNWGGVQNLRPEEKISDGGGCKKKFKVGGGLIELYSGLHNNQRAMIINFDLFSITTIVIKDKSRKCTITQLLGYLHVWWKQLYLGQCLA